MKKLLMILALLAMPVMAQEFGRMWPQTDLADLNTLKTGLISYAYDLYPTLDPESETYSADKAACHAVMSNAQKYVKEFVDVMDVHPSVEFVWDPDESSENPNPRYQIEWNGNEISMANAETLWGLLWKFVAKH